MNPIIEGNHQIGSGVYVGVRFAALMRDDEQGVSGMTGSTLMFGILDGSLGTGYFIYGKKQQRWVPMLAGAGLCVVPYLFDNPWLLAAVSIFLCLFPLLVFSE